MTNINDLLTGTWAHAVGWTLLHSLWQALLIFSIVGIGLRLMPARHSGLRYNIACGGLLLFVITASVTFFYSLEDLRPVAAARPVEYTVVMLTDQAPTLNNSIFSEFIRKVDQSMPWMLVAWASGLAIFVARFFSGLLYTSRLRASAFAINNEWSEFVEQTRKALGIPRLVALAESAAITAPVVIGYFKPIILIPVGMMTGLTTEQLETVLLHELAHIRRHDFLINIFQ